MIGKAPARHGSIVIVSPSANLRMWSWHVAVPRWGPWAWPLIISEHVPQMPSRQSWSNVIGSWPSLVQPLVDDVEHLEERGVVADVVGRRRSRSARRSSGPSWRHTFSVTLRVRRHLLVAPLGQVDVLELERLLVDRCSAAHVAASTPTRPT